MCGEKFLLAIVFLPVQGSPPHVRGKESLFTWFVKTFRITPACAGKREKDKVAQTKAEDHPRMCGEKF